MAKDKSTRDVSSALDIFKRQEKRYNFAVLRVLSLYGSQEHKKIHSKVKRMPKCGAIREGSLYKRLRNLVNGGYVFDNPPNKSSRAKSFELSEKGHLALTARDVTMQELIVLADEIDSKDLNAVIKRILAKRKPPNRNHPF